MLHKSKVANGYSSNGCKITNSTLVVMTTEPRGHFHGEKMKRNVTVNVRLGFRGLQYQIKI